MRDGQTRIVCLHTGEFSITQMDEMTQQNMALAEPAAQTVPTATASTSRVKSRVPAASSRKVVTGRTPQSIAKPAVNDGWE